MGNWIRRRIKNPKLRKILKRGGNRSLKNPGRAKTTVKIILKERNWPKLYYYKQKIIFLLNTSEAIAQDQEDEAFEAKIKSKNNKQTEVEEGSGEQEQKSSKKFDWMDEEDELSEFCV